MKTVFTTSRAHNTEKSIKDALAGTNGNGGSDGGSGSGGDGVEVTKVKAKR